MRHAQCTSTGAETISPLIYQPLFQYESFNEFVKQKHLNLSGCSPASTFPPQLGLRGVSDGREEPPLILTDVTTHEQLLYSSAGPQKLRLDDLTSTNEAADVPGEHWRIVGSFVLGMLCLDAAV